MDRVNLGKNKKFIPFSIKFNQGKLKLNWRKFLLLFIYFKSAFNKADLDLLIIYLA